MGSPRAYLITLASVELRLARIRPALAWVAATVAFLLIVQLLWGPPAGIVVQGALLGGLSALLALGLALVYRAHRILNFAQGDLGAAPASLAVLLVVTSGASWLVAFVAGLATAVVVGVLVELLVIRRFFRAPRLVLSVATIGLAQVLAGIGLLLPGWFGVDLPPQSFPAPIDVSFTVEPLRFGGNDVVALIAIPLAFVGIALFLRTRIGLATRACADDVDRAALVGIPVRRVHSVVWAIAALLAFLAVFLRAGIVGLSLGTVLGPSLLLPALAAAVIGRMERLPTIAAAAIALGVIEQSVVWGWNQPSDVYPVLFVVVVVAVWLTPAGAGLRSRLEPSTWRTVREPRPVPRQLARLPEVRIARGTLLALVAVTLVLVPVVFTESRTNLAAVAVVYGIIALSLVVLTGWAGEISLGQMAFVAVGAAVGASLTARLGWDLALGLLGAGVVGAALAALIGLPVLRRRGLTLAVITLAFGLATTAWLLSPRIFGDGTRFDWLPPPRVERPHLFGVIDVNTESRYYVLCLVALALVIAAVVGIRRSRTGRALVAIRENDRAASRVRREPAHHHAAGVRGVGLPRRVGGRALRAPAERAPARLLRRGREPGGLHHGGGRRSRLGARGAPRRALRPRRDVVAPGRLADPGDGGRDARRPPRVPRRTRRRARRRARPAPPVGGTAARHPGACAAPAPWGRSPSEPCPRRRGRPATRCCRCAALAVEHDGVPVLDGIDLDAHAGEIVALLGTNGSGKSTLLDAIAGLHRPRAGRITIDGVDTTRTRADQVVTHGLAEAPAEHGVFPTLTVRENLRLATWQRPRAAPRPEARWPTRSSCSRASERGPRSAPATCPAASSTCSPSRWPWPPRPGCSWSTSSPSASRPRPPAGCRTGCDPFGTPAGRWSWSSSRSTARWSSPTAPSSSTRARSATAERPQACSSGPTWSRDLPRGGGCGADARRCPTRGRAEHDRRARAGARAARRVRALRWSRRTHRRVARRRPRRDRRRDRAERRRQDHAVRRHLGVRPPRRRHDHAPRRTRLAGARRDTRRAARRASLGLGRSFQDGRLFPALTVRETIAVACERTVASAIRSPPRSTSPPSPAPKRPSAHASTSSSTGCVSAPTPTASVTSSPPGRAASSTSRACSRTSRRSCSSTNLASGVAQREAEALGPLLTEVRDELDAAVLVVEHDLGVLGRRRRPHRGPRPGPSSSPTGARRGSSPIPPWSTAYLGA